MDDLVPSWDESCQVDIGCWPDHGQRNRHFTTSWAQIWHRAKVSVKGIIMDIMVLFDSFVQTLGLWPSLAISGRPTSRFWILWTFGENGEATSKRIGAVSVTWPLVLATQRLNWTPKLQKSYLFDSEGMREKKKTYVCYIMIISWAYHDHMIL